MTFDFNIYLVIITQEYISIGGTDYSGLQQIFIKETPSVQMIAVSSSQGRCVGIEKITWTENSLSWYTTYNGGSYQMNSKDQTYHVLALGYKEES